MTIQSNRRMFLQSTLAAGTMVSLGGTSQGTDRPEPAGNPPIRPGRVRWHSDFNAACTAARNSGKPVLHFHMLGRLDEKFC